MTKHQQELLPLSGLYQCETCFADVPISVSLKSRQRYDQHTLCFKHQLVYKKQQIIQQRSDRRSNRRAAEKTLT